jgi:hypothetical protein
LTGHVAQITPPQLVINAKAKANGVTPISSGELTEMFGDYLRQKKLREFTNATTKEFLQSIGRSPGSASYLQTQMREHGLAKNISKNPTQGRWQLQGMKATSKRKAKVVRPRKAAAKAQAPAP